MQTDRVHTDVDTPPFSGKMEGHQEYFNETDAAVTGW
jgi:hypothetical protein